jgi:2'-5' RNA ligase
MALLSLRVPQETARLLSSLDVPGEKEGSAFMHVTLLYLEDASIEEVIRAISATYRVTNETAPFLLRASSISHFDGGEKVPIICPIESAPLHEFQFRLRNAFDQDGIPYSKKFPEYKPHVTLSYAEAPLEENVDQTIEPYLEWGAHSVTLWAGQNGDEGLSCELAFKTPHVNKVASVDPKKRNAIKAAMLIEKLLSS